MRSPLDLDALAEVPVFAGVDLAALPGRVAEKNAKVRIRRGEILFHQGDRSTGFYFVRSGRIRLTVNNRSGTTATVEIIGAGETFGEAVVFLEQPYPVTASALADSVLYFIATSVVDAMLTDDPRTARRLLANLSMRNHRLVADLAALTLESATGRVCDYLLRLAADLPTTSSPRVRLELPDAKKVVANRLSLTPESLSRALRILADDGLIGVDGRHIEFEPTRLADHLNGM